MKKINNKVLTIVIIGLVVTITGTAIFLGVWFRPINVIEIYEDKDFSRKYHFPGKGTEEDPFIIDGYELSGNRFHNIKIYDITKHFVIQNCVLRNSNKGIDLRGLSNGIAKIVNNTIQSNDYGVIIRISSNCLISGNKFFKNGRGIEATSTGSLEITSNTFLKNQGDGIHVLDNYNTSIKKNTFDSCEDGFTILDSELISIEKNYLINCTRWGAQMQYIKNIQFDNNTVINCGLGVAIVYSQNVNIVGNNLTENGSGLLISYTNNGLIKENNCSKNVYYGISAYGISDSLFSNNNLISNNVSGLYVWLSYSTEINNNSYYNNTLGMELYCSRIPRISFNVFEHNLEYGMVTQGVNTTIWNNNFIDNNYNNIPSIQAQAKVAGNCTDYVGYPQWFDEENDQGNYWSDIVWFSGMEYIIDPGNYTDNYPLEEPVTIKI